MPARLVLSQKQKPSLFRDERKPKGEKESAHKVLTNALSLSSARPEERSAKQKKMDIDSTPSLPVRTSGWF